jgi:hypothetical protein
VPLDRVHVWLATITVVVVVAACGTAPAADPGDDDPRFGDEGLSGMCESMDVDIAADAEGYPTEAGAIAAFVAEHAVLEDTTVSDGTVLFDGEEVGTLSVTEAPGGGFFVTSASWCYP